MKNLIHQLLVITLRILAHLPLIVSHGIGALLGLLNYFLNQKSRKHARLNVTQSGLVAPKNLNKMLIKNAIENGKGLMETLSLWLKPYPVVLSYVRGVTGLEAVNTALKKNKGVIFLTPHLGCFEITSLYYGSHNPITVLYRPPRQAWLLPLLVSGRERGNIKLAPANMQGVRELLGALKRNEAIGILPDQTPAEGEGEWADFFGKPAYTMTLASKLASKTGAAIFMAYGERLSWGRGYHFHIKPVENTLIHNVQGLNHAIETQIAEKPSQYLWAYPRYKTRQFNREKLTTFEANKHSQQ